MDIVAILNGLPEFLRVGTGVIYQYFNRFEQLIFFGKKFFFHVRKLLDQLIQALTYGISLYRYYFPASGELQVRCMNMNLDGHNVLLIKTGGTDKRWINLKAAVE